MSSSDPAPGQRRWRLDLAYDGTGLAGVAEQPDADTVNGRLRAALSTVLATPCPPLVVAGRTDAGVHALAQVAHVDLPESLEPDGVRLIGSLNALLAPRVRVLSARVAPEGFHARFSATWRAYRYLVLESPRGLGLTEPWSWAVPGPLDLEAMNAEATAALGERDFRSFCRRPPDRGPEDPLRREVLECAWRRLPDTWALSPEGASVLRLDIRANAFCHQMVRSLVATMVAVGRGRLAPGTLAERLAHPQRTGLPAPAPAAGLALVGVGYPELAGGPSGSVG